MHISKKTFRFAAGLLLSTSFITYAATASDTKTQPSTLPAQSQKIASPSASLENADKNTVLATVNDKKITIGDVINAQKQLPAQLQQIPIGALLPMILNQLVAQEAMKQLAYKNNFQDNPEVQKQLEAIKNDVVISAYVKSIMEPKITDQAIQNYFNQNYANKPPVKAAHIRHILVKTKAEADKIIKGLNAKKSFTDLAKQYSIDKTTSVQNGGDLGWLKADELVPAFSKAAFAMPANTYSKTPIQTQFGWHVIQVLGYKDVPAATLEQVKPEILEKLRRQEVQHIVDDAIKQSKVTKNESVINQYTVKLPTSAPAR
ncbi:Putative peptidyl-prolyl cis-trans isomerase [Commensalibacter sp. Nvir]|uniref:peptidylprolyl isomerase n=1 Tax=Commensalibacter sp. Nvir TaxID=3069817 RepID=UPI002D5C2F47|nr:Putative peptidyl-prolyl cis-trans isomerase [Commensalibacter sp. Nvir]